VVTETHDQINVLATPVIPVIRWRMGAGDIVKLNATLHKRAIVAVMLKLRNNFDHHSLLAFLSVLFYHLPELPGAVHK
jgi:hypothetical protein